ncbi:protein PIN-LIKES 3-like [Alnus glutinosa]|uniref:protein PIN-LIKES 3-like n=1 Tax=Alnus glutinosa TaxID=3517 RepID=UPI002D79FDB7|nr:protein PIN-LIKES 3-like [Alnus glutinosa]XP_062143298.1 protein PIN-LIKES 3-like [Alnus glutinosa]
MEILDLFIVALMPVLKTLLITAVGLLIAIDRIGLLGPDARHHLNNIVFYVFTPALMVSNLSETITLDSMITLWFMPVNILLTFLIGSILAWLLIKITRTPKHLHGLVIGCCSAGNLGNLLLIIVPAVCDETNSPFGDSSTCSTNGEAYASLSMAVGAIYIWSYVYMIMRVFANKTTEDIDTHDSTMSITFSGEPSETFSGTCTEALLPSRDCPSSDDHSAYQVDLPRIRSVGKVSILNQIIERTKKFAGHINLKMVFAPSTIGVIVGFIIGIISPIQKLMIGDSAPLRVIISSASLLGEATIPSMTLIVGANLLKGLRRSEVGLILIVGVIAVRYIVLPLLGVVIVKAAHSWGMVGSNSLYQFILMLQYALPPAMSVGTITQLFGAGESECSVIMLWTYAVASFSLTFWSTFYMWLVS